MRKILLWSGKQLVDTKFGGIMTLLIAVLALILPAVSPDALKNTFDFQSLTGLITYVITVIIIILVAYFVIQAIGHLLIFWSKNIRPKVKIVPLDPPDHIETRVDGQLFISTFASLKIINNEDAELTECFAVLKSGQPGGMPKEIWDWVEPGTKKISWQNTTECFITIGAWNGEEILHIFVLSYNAHERKILSSNFCVCNEDRGLKSPHIGHDFSIEFNCKLNGESIKPIPFHGYFPLAIQETKDSFMVSGLVIREGENKDRRVVIKNPNNTPTKKGF